MTNSNDYINYEIELIINENLYKKNIITDDIYKKVNEKLIKLIRNSKANKKPINDTG